MTEPATHLVPRLVVLQGHTVCGRAITYRRRVLTAHQPGAMLDHVGSVRVCRCILSLVLSPRWYGHHRARLHREMSPFAVCRQLHCFDEVATVLHAVLDESAMGSRCAPCLEARLIWKRAAACRRERRSTLSRRCVSGRT